MSIQLAYSAWWILVCLLAGLALAALLYYSRPDHNISKKLRLLLASLRGLGIAILCFLLLSPFLKLNRNQTQKPAVILLQDNSLSVGRHWAGTDSTVYLKQWQDLKKKLQADFDVTDYRFGQSLQAGGTPDFKDPITNIDEALDEATGKTALQDNVAIILASDGLFNEGADPAFRNYPFSGSLYTLALGDTTAQKDSRIAQALYNKVVNLGDRFTIKADLVATGLGNESSTFSVFHHNAGKTVFSKAVTYQGNRFTTAAEMVLDAPKSGLQHYTLTLQPVAGEINTSNNKLDVFIEVTEQKQRILIAGAAPHPDIAALKAALSVNKQNEITIKTGDELPASATGYDLIIAHQLPSVSQPAGALFNSIKQTNTSVWFITGLQSQLNLLNTVQQAAGFANVKGLSNDAFAQLNPNFSYFTLPPGSAADLAKLPPLTSPFADIKAGGGSQVLLTQKIGNVATQNPLFILQVQGNQRVGILAGEGLWRWRMHDYLQHQNYQLTNDIIQKAVQLLAAKKDQRKFRVSPSKLVFSDIEPVVLNGELYNDNNELINTAQATVTLRDSSGKAYPYDLIKTEAAYTVNTGALAPGNYTFEATTNMAGKKLNASGAFTVIHTEPELLQTTANHRLLYQLSQQYDGKIFYPSQTEQLYQAIKQNPRLKPVLKQQKESNPLIDWKWLFAILVLIFGTEWLLRKRNGLY